MTTPQERMRAIGWGADLLLSLQNDPTIPEDFKVRANGIATCYPSTDMLSDLVASSARAFPAAAGLSIEEARSLFQAVQASGVGNEETRRDLLYTMRHFPLAAWACVADQAARIGSLSLWLAPDET